MAHRSLLVNILRNLRDQPLHALWAGASIFAPFAAQHWLHPLLVALTLLCSFGSITWIVLREYAQFPPHDWWDAPLDWSLYVVGGVAGLVGGVLLIL